MKYINEDLAKSLGMSDKQYSDNISNALDACDVHMYEPDYGLTLNDIKQTLDVSLIVLFETAFPLYYCTPYRLKEFSCTIIKGDGECEVCGGDIEGIGTIGQTSTQIDMEIQCRVCGMTDNVWVDKDTSWFHENYH